MGFEEITRDPLVYTIGLVQNSSVRVVSSMRVLCVTELLLSRALAAPAIAHKLFWLLVHSLPNVPQVSTSNHYILYNVLSFSVVKVKESHATYLRSFVAEKYTQSDTYLATRLNLCHFHPTVR